MRKLVATDDVSNRQNIGCRSLEIFINLRHGSK
jgi:hypothetical protein